MWGIRQRARGQSRKTSYVLPRTGGDIRTNTYIHDQARAKRGGYPPMETLIDINDQRTNNQIILPQYTEQTQHKTRSEPQHDRTRRIFPQTQIKQRHNMCVQES